jgi:hypothetical protein
VGKQLLADKGASHGVAGADIHGIGGVGAQGTEANEMCTRRASSPINVERFNED